MELSAWEEQWSADDGPAAGSSLGSSVRVWTGRGGAEKKSEGSAWGCTVMIHS